MCNTFTYNTSAYSHMHYCILVSMTAVGSSVYSGAQSWHVTCMEYMVSVLVQVPVVSEMHEQWHP